MLWVSNGLKNEMMLFTTLLCEAINDFKWSHMVMFGSSIGLTLSVITENLGNIALTAIMAFVGAVFAGLGKLLVSWISRKLKLSKDKKNEDE